MEESPDVSVSSVEVTPVVVTLVMLVTVESCVTPSSPATIQTRTATIHPRFLLAMAVSVCLSPSVSSVPGVPQPNDTVDCGWVDK